jgi:YVTN family beta-propeller protein
MFHRTARGASSVWLSGALAIVTLLLVSATAGAFAPARAVSDVPSLTSASRANTPPSPTAPSGAAQAASPSVSLHADGTPTVASTLVLFNDSLVPGNFLADYGTDANDVAVDTVTEDLFVSDEGTDEVSIIHQVSGVGIEVIAVAQVGSYPEGVVYDPIDQSVYVADWQSGTVDVINGTTFAVGSISVGGEPIALAFDSHDGDIYVANWETTQVDIINGTTNATYSPITGIGGSGAGSPDAVVFDSATNQIFVANKYRPSPYTSMPVNIINDSTNTVYRTAWVGNEPDALAYDPGAGEVFVANSMSNNITAIDDTNDHIVGNWDGFDGPDGVAYSPVDDCIYVSNSGSDTVAVWYPATHLFQYNVTVGVNPGGVIYAQFDDGDNLIEVANSGSSNVSILDDSANYVDYTVSLEAQPYGVAYDSVDNELFTANYVANGSVDVINDTSNLLTPVTAIPVGPFPVGVAYDPAQDYVFVTNSRSESVSVINAFDGANNIVGTISVGSFPWGITYDPRQGEVFVANSGAGTISVINATTLSVTAVIPLGSTYDPEGLAYDSATGFVYVALFTQKSVALIDAANNGYYALLPAGTYPEWVAYDSDDSEVFVSNYGSDNVTAYRQTSNTNYWVVANITVGGGPTGVTYDAATDQVFVSNSLSDTVSVIDPVTGSETGGVTVGGDPYALAVDSAHSTLYVTNFRQGTVTILSIPPYTGNPTVTFDEQYLPSGATWYVNITGQPPLSATVSGASGTSLEATLPGTGTYTYSAATNWKNWTPSYTGSLTVTPSNPPVYISFFEVTYPVYANETGLPVGATWYFNITGVVSDEEQVFSGGGNSTGAYLDNGTYIWTLTTTWTNYSTINSSGEFNVAGGPQSVLATFTEGGPRQYLVTFDAIALPQGLTWYVNVSGESARSATVAGSLGQSIAIELANGSYTFSASTEEAAWTWNSSATGTSVDVIGAPQSLPVYFNGPTSHATPPVYVIEFSETGLPSGTVFNVLIDGRNLTTTAPTTLSTELANGSYPYSVPNHPPYVANFSSGTLVVHGQSETVAITFSNSTGTTSTTSSSFPWIWVAVPIAIIVAVLFLLLLLARRRKKKEEPPPATGGPTTSSPEPSPPAESTTGSP